MRLLVVLLAAAAAALSGCAAAPKTPVPADLAYFPHRTVTERMLNDLPPPAAPVAVAVYNFGDQSGQFKNAGSNQTLSRAVSQGGASILVKALQDAGQRSWFTVVEREQLKDLLNERQVISEMRQRYLGEKAVNPQALPALLFAGVLLEGGVISYDTNTRTGGIGAALLGITLDRKWQQDTVTVYLRAVSVKTGEILLSVTASKTVTSTAYDGDAFGYVAHDKIFQTDNGFTSNEPTQLALQQAVEKAVYALVMEGVDLKLWGFKDAEAGWPHLWRYQQERDGLQSPEQVWRAERDTARRAQKQATAQAAMALAPSISWPGRRRPRTPLILDPTPPAEGGAGAQPTDAPSAETGGS